jgi:Spy/CpxP family protein refolding chaperone
MSGALPKNISTIEEQMKMTKVSLIAALALGGLLAGATVSFAQDNGTNNPPHRGRPGMMGIDQRVEHMAKQLNLTDAQKPKVKAILEASEKKMQELHADTSLSQEDRRTKMRAIMEDQHKDIKAILTPEQAEKFPALRPGGPGRPPGPPAAPAAPAGQ